MYNRIIEICKNKNTTLTKVLKELEIPTSNTGIWKKGKKPNGEQIIKLCEYLNISADELLFGKKNNDQKIINEFFELSEIHKKEIETIIIAFRKQEIDQKEENLKMQGTG